MLLFLPFFAKKADGNIQSVSLIALDGIQSYLKNAYFVIVIAVVVMGILTLALQNIQTSLWLKSKRKISLIIGVISILLFMISSQPYAAAFAFALLIIKALMLTKRT